MPMPLFARDIDGAAIAEPGVTLPGASPGEELAGNHAALRLSLHAHPVASPRDALTPGRRLRTARDAAAAGA